MKRIVVACDGTWNTPDQTDRGERRPTNIVKLVRGVQPVDSHGVPQISFYDKGLGTEWGISKWIEGATGYGISNNILDAYQFISLNYVPGDEIYLFGFSRGAFTAQSLVGLISHIGVLPKGHNFYTPEAYELYRTNTDATVFRDKNHSYVAHIRFLGVFDTVGALGIPVGMLNFLTRRKHHFHDVQLSDIVDHAFHALAIDEKRKQFSPTLWQPAEPVSVERMEQVWYAGVHANIGGGYSPDGLANIPLHSVKKRAAALGLEFDASFLANYQPNPVGDTRKSRKGIYRLTRKIDRKIGQAKNGNERIHEAVYRRLKSKDLDYRPANILATDDSE